MKRLQFTRTEGKDRLYHLRLKKEFYQSQIDKLPNEFKDAFDDYNFRNSNDVVLIDENKYDSK
jgi:hypothetical protein